MSLYFVTTTEVVMLEKQDTIRTYNGFFPKLIEHT